MEAKNFCNMDFNMLIRVETFYSIKAKKLYRIRHLFSMRVGLFKLYANNNLHNVLSSLLSLTKSMIVQLFLLIEMKLK